MNEEIKRKSRYLTLLLRHSPEKENLDMDEQAYVEVKQILSVLNLTQEELEWIVENDSKSRFKFNYNKTKIRACQGHSLPWVQLQYESRIPPSILYHGTNENAWNTIKRDGIQKMKRQYVHLSNDFQTALAVGKRNGRPLILKIDTESMVKDGIKFYLSDNGVWLTDFVDKKYINGYAIT